MYLCSKDCSIGHSGECHTCQKLNQLPLQGKFERLWHEQAAVTYDAIGDSLTSLTYFTAHNQACTGMHSRKKLHLKLGRFWFICFFAAHGDRPEQPHPSFYVPVFFNCSLKKKTLRGLLTTLRCSKVFLHVLCLIPAETGYALRYWCCW